MNGHLEVVKVLVAAGADAAITNGAGRDAVVEAEMSSKEKAGECAEWMLKNCEGLDNGVGRGVEEVGEAQDDQQQQQQEEEIRLDVKNEEDR
jgi:hypothetical protein